MFFENLRKLGRNRQRSSDDKATYARGSSSPKIRKPVMKTALIVSPMLILVLSIVWFSENQISPGSWNEASLANPFGFIFSNFVYDGSINVENVILSSIFLLAALAYFPKIFRPFAVFLVPFIAIASGAIAELIAILSPLCSGNCYFAGMSGIASSLVGFTFAGFLISFLLVFLANSRKLRIRRTLRNRSQDKVLLPSSFVIYLVLLLFFSGAFTLQVPTPSPLNQGTPSPPTTVFIQQAIQEPAPVKIVHSGSLIFGFLLFLALYLLVDYRYKFLDTVPK